MAAKIIDGKALAAKCKAYVTGEVKAMGKKPGLAVIIVGDNPASRTYVTSKEKDCAECGIYSEEYALPADASQDQLLELIEQLNRRDNIDGILCQLPLPKKFNEQKVLMAIDPNKDVDGFHPMNAGRLATGQAGFVPCTPAGVMAMLEEYGVEVAGKNCVVVGRSNIVGKPMAMLLLKAHGTVTICHSRTPDLGGVCRRADILVAAVGKRNIVTADMVKEGAVVIDVAMNRDDNGKLCGDVDYAPTAEKAFYITPVPGGVGPMTRAMLLKNTLTAARMHGK